MQATYKKLRDGSWGIRTADGIPGVGDDVEVTQKSGEIKNETVTKIIWQGQNDEGFDASICEIQQRDRDGNPIAKPQQQQQRQGGQQRQGQGNQRQVEQQRQSTSKCKCLGCGTTDPNKEYYCSDCVLNGAAANNANGGGQTSDTPGDGEDDNDIPF